MKIQIVNHLGAEHDDDAERIAQAMQLYAQMVAKDHELASPLITFIRGASVPANDADELGLFESPDVSGALGYHDIDPRGRPYGKAFLSVVPGRVMLHDKTGHGASLAGVVSHELAEMLGDRFANLWAFGKIRDPRSKRHYGAIAYELADPVQDAAFQLPAHDGSAVDCSDYVLPAYFDPATPATARTSHTGAAVGPMVVAPGGYAIVAQERSEAQVFGEERAPASTHSRSLEARHDTLEHEAVAPPTWRAAMTEHHYSRRSRRHRQELAAA